MKKLLFLISLCLLSQNCTLASGCVQRGDITGFAAPVPLNAAQKSQIPQTQNSSPQQKPVAAVAVSMPPVPVIISSPLPEEIVRKETEIIAEPQPKLPPVQDIKHIVNQEISKPPRPQTQAEEHLQEAKTEKTTQDAPAEMQAPIELTQISKPETKQASQPEPAQIVQHANPPAASNTPQLAQIPPQDVPKTEATVESETEAIPAPKAETKADAKTETKAAPEPENNSTADSQETYAMIQESSEILLPPVPAQYLETSPEQEKYKLQDKKKLNLFVEKKQRPPVIVEDNLSQPGDSDEIRVNLTRIEFPESQVFTQEELQQLASPLLKQSVTIADIQKVINGITRCYILGDYATSKAYLPPQDISEGVLKIGLFEGTVGKVTINDNRWTKTGYIKNRIGLKEGELLKISDLEDDIVKFNNNNDVKLRVELSAGEQQGETDITLNAIDPFPFHIAFMSDNQGRQSIGKARWGSMLTADSLFGHRDRLSLGGYLGHGNRVGFADYNIPLNRFGTRLGASVSAGNIAVINGPMRPFGIGGTSQVYSVYLTHPLLDRQGFNLSSYTAGNIKHSTTDISGFKLYDISTFSVTQGFTAKKDTERGIWYTGHYGSVGFKALGGDEDFFKYEGNITRLHDFGKGIIGQFRVSGQYSPDNGLPWMEQFQIGGLSTVRGYSEGLLLGKSGYFASAEIITPLPFLPKAIGSDRLGYIYPREMIKGAVFMDNGMIFPYKAGEAIDSGEFLMSWGLGLRVNLARDLAARLYWGFGLKNRYETDNHFGRFHFELTCAPDVGRLVADRHPSKSKKRKKKKENL